MSSVLYNLERIASVKDIIESLGIPHPEIENIVANKRQVGFDYRVDQGDSIEVFPISSRTDFFSYSILRPPLPDGFGFLCDVNIGKLAKWLRLLGFDAIYGNHFEDKELAELAGKSGRVLLTKDCNLLKRKQVVWGHLVSVDEPDEQIIEVVKLFNLQSLVRPYSRCLGCNGVLSYVDKDAIDHLLEPLTRKYYTNFHQCQKCKQVYWQGTHRTKMEAKLRSVLERCS